MREQSRWRCGKCVVAGGSIDAGSENNRWLKAAWSRVVSKGSVGLNVGRGQSTIVIGVNHRQLHTHLPDLLAEHSRPARSDPHGRRRRRS